MKIKLVTPVNRNFKEVYEKFDRQLFEFLQPSFPKMKLIEFQSQKPGNIVHIEFIFPLKAKWVSIITEEESNDQECFFIDEGEVLPPGISFWRHKHIVKRTGKDTCEIIDDIEYKSPNKIIEALMYPQLYMSFYPRKKAYQKYFNK